MDKTEQLAEAIYNTMEELHESIAKNLAGKISFNDKRYEFARELYQSLNEEKKELLLGYIKGLLSDAYSTVLASLDGVRDIEDSSCSKIEIVCDNERLDPYLQELFLAIFQEKNQDMQ